MLEPVPRGRLFCCLQSIFVTFTESGDEVALSFAEWLGDSENGFFLVHWEFLPCFSILPQDLDETV